MVEIPLLVGIHGDVLWSSVMAYEGPARVRGPEQDATFGQETDALSASVAAASLGDMMQARVTRMGCLFAGRRGLTRRCRAQRRLTSR